jgi:hypothetical protein
LTLRVKRRDKRVARSRPNSEVMNTGHDEYGYDPKSAVAIHELQFDFRARFLMAAEQAYFGGFISPASQPHFSDFMGSVATARVST